jgi:hypothetical protein
MKNIFSMVCWILACLFFLLSCSSPKDNVQTDIEHEYINQQILLKAPNFGNTFKTEDPIFLDILSQSSNEIVFPNNYNLKIFAKTNEGWIEIKEIPTTRFPEGDTILSPTAQIRESFAVTPDLVDYSKRYQLRIYVIGDMETNEGIKKVAAYIDLTLNP